jgi:phosphate transport system substrate-binding protein
MMNNKAVILFKRSCTMLLLLSASHVLAKDLIKIEGSSTVYPIIKQLAQEYMLADNNRTQVVIGITGTGGGFRKFCRGRTDISNASRRIKPSEIELCKTNGVTFLELPIALDAITVVVNKNNHWLDALSIAELANIWQASSAEKMTLWSDVNNTFPQYPLTLHAPGSDSGTYDYFKDVVLNKAESRQDYIANEDDNAMAAEVAADMNAMAFLGYGYYQQNLDKLKAIAITNDSDTPIIPSVENVINGKYAELSRPLFLYVNQKALANRASVLRFLNHIFQPKIIERSVNHAGYVPLPENVYREAQSAIDETTTESRFSRDDMATNF